jgi:hypothetical protein
MNEKFLVIAWVGMLIAVAVLFVNALNLPIVQVTSISNTCVQVLTPAPSSFNCENLPQRYTTEWVSE